MQYADEVKYHEDTKEAQGNTVQLNKQETILYGITTTTSSSTPTTVTATSTTSGSTQTTVTTVSTSTATAPPGTTTPAGGVGIYVQWSYTESTKVTNISMTVTNLDAGQYAAVGLGQTASMV